MSELVKVYFCESVDPLILRAVLSPSEAPYASSSSCELVEIKVLYASDCALLHTVLPYMSLSSPFVFGWDFVGETQQVCSVYPSKSLVFGFLEPHRPGALTSGTLTVPVHQVRAVPAELSSAPAWLCASILPCLVGEQLLRKTDFDTRLLILGGSTWFGRFLVQLAKQMFEIEWVAVTIENEKDRLCLEQLGADEVYNTSFARPRLFSCSPSSQHWSTPFARSKAKRDYTLIVDLVDDPAAKTLLASGGRFAAFNKIPRRANLNQWISCHCNLRPTVGIFHNFRSAVAVSGVETFLPDFAADLLDRLAIIAAERRLPAVEFELKSLDQSSLGSFTLRPGGTPGVVRMVEETSPVSPSV